MDSLAHNTLELSDVTGEVNDVHSREERDMSLLLATVVVHPVGSENAGGIIHAPDCTFDCAADVRDLGE